MTNFINIPLGLLLNDLTDFRTCTLDNGHKKSRLFSCVLEVMLARSTIQPICSFSFNRKIE